MIGKFAFILLLKQLAVTKALDCGVVYDTVTGNRIIGGYEGGALMYPWFAVLRYNAPGDQAICAGALITPKHILTAAHCFQADTSRPKKDVFTVAMNVYDRCNTSEPWEVHNVTKAVAHEKYHYPADPFDMAMLTLETPSKLPTVCMPEASSQDVSEPALIMGFGYTKEGAHEQPCNLQQAQIQRHTKEECQNMTSLPAKDTSDNGTFCAGAQGKDTCQGDSGGPLLTQAADGRYIVSGIVSYGYGCGRDGYPGVYTNVAYYLDWIAGQIDGETTETAPKSSAGGSQTPANWQTEAFGGAGGSSESRQGGVWFGSQSAANSARNLNSGPAMNPSGSAMGGSAVREVSFPGSRVASPQPQGFRQNDAQFNMAPQDNSWRTGGAASLDTADGRAWYTPEGRRLDAAPQQSDQSVKFPNSNVDPRNG